MDTSRSFDDYPEKMTSEQVAELFGHPRKQIEVWAREGTIPARKDGWFWVFDRDEVVDWIRQHRITPDG
jgi:excisionase family DNA binding protein